MVLENHEYSKVYKDPDLYGYNINLPEKERLEIGLTYILEYLLQLFSKKKTYLNYTLCHNLENEDKFLILFYG